MASLPKPTNCDICDSNEFVHKFKPEQWVCIDCNNIQIERPQRNDPNKCRDCGALRESKKFKKGKNQCMDCFNNYMVKWRQDNQEHWRKYKSRPEIKKNRQETVRKSIQSSSKSFITYLFGRLKKSSSKDNRILRKASGKILAIDIDLDFLLQMYDDQGGKCALSGMEMTHKFNDFCSISIDRVDSGVGYVGGNVQLVCKWVNLAKQSYSNECFLGLLDMYYECRRVREVGLEHVEFSVRGV